MERFIKTFVIDCAPYPYNPTRIDIVLEDSFTIHDVRLASSHVFFFSLLLPLVLCSPCPCSPSLQISDKISEATGYIRGTFQVCSLALPFFFF